MGFCKYRDKDSLCEYCIILTKMEGEKGNEWSAVWAEGIASMMFTFMACGVITASGNVTFEELNAPRLAAIALARKYTSSCVSLRQSVCV